jgi:hypothetical protein
MVSKNHVVALGHPLCPYGIAYRNKDPLYVRTVLLTVGPMDLTRTSIYPGVQDADGVEESRGGERRPRADAPDPSLRPHDAKPHQLQHVPPASYTSFRTCACTYIYCVYVCIPAYMLCIRMYTRTYTADLAPMPRIQVFARMMRNPINSNMYLPHRICLFVHVHIHTYIYTCIYSNTCTYIDIYICTSADLAPMPPIQVFARMMHNPYQLQHVPPDARLVYI